jgi:Flp pilus assembly protein TadD
VLWAEGRREEAEALLQKALRDAPDNETVHATIERVRSGQ